MEMRQPSVRFTLLGLAAYKAVEFLGLGRGLSVFRAILYQL